MSDVFTFEDVAERLQVSVGTVKRLVREGRLPYRRVGDRMVRFTQQDVDEYLRSVAKRGPKVAGR